jgi:hypothetical protein
MSRKLLVTIHLYLAAFFAPLVIAMAVSGGLYLVGVKGEMTTTVVANLGGVSLNADSATLATDVNKVLQQVGIIANFEQVKARDNSFQTRPSSRTHYLLRQNSDGVEIREVSPDLQAAMMELHKGHGPAMYKQLQKVFAVGLLFIILSGLYLGLMSPMYRIKTVVISAFGLLLFAGLVLF